MEVEREVWSRSGVSFGSCKLGEESIESNFALRKAKPKRAANKQIAETMASGSRGTLLSSAQHN